MTETAVILDDLSAGHGRVALIEHVHATVGKGGMLALCGGNGSGKSTLVRTVAGVLPIVSGSVEVLGDLPGRRPDGVAYMPQHLSSHTLPLRVIDVVRMGRFARRGLLGRMTRGDRDFVAESLERVGMGGAAHEPLEELSGGQRRRVHLAQALAHGADLLLLDEPTAGIDAAGRERYFEILAEERARGVAVVVATHDFAEARLADTVLLLSRRVVASGAPAEVLTRDNLAATFGVSITEVGSATMAAETHHHHHDTDDDNGIQDR